MIRKILFIFFLILVGINAFSQSPSQKRSLLVQSSVQVSPPRITLSWTTYSTSTGYSVFRKLKSSTTWGNAIATPAAGATQYIDTTPSVGVYYEYKVSRSSSVGVAIGYVSAGIEVPAVDYRGKIVLIVDNTMSAPLATELTQLESDLIGDGWGVVRQDVSRTASPSSIRSIIQSIYNSDPTNVKAVYLFGHIPVYYSGNINPDGHDSIPFSVDSYYAEMNSTWPSSPLVLPSDAELQVGRVDLYKMPAFSLSETELLRAYLNKSHNFKSKQFEPQFRGLMSDNLQWVPNPCAEGGFRTMGALVGSTNLTTIPYNGFPQFWSVVNNEYLWTYCSGGGTYISANNIGSTQNFASAPHNGIFNMTFGSYFGNWDSATPVPDWNNGTNNFMRSPLASGKALTNCYDAQPTWYFHHMGMGDNIGYGTLLSLNNRAANALYQPQSNGWDPQGYSTIHLSLMGDPSLRLQMVGPPSNLIISNVGGNFSFSWTASTDLVLGYLLYEISPDGIISRIHPNIITGTSFTSGTMPYVSGKKIMVRSVKMQTSNTGTYQNLSLGAISVAPVSAPPVVKVDIKVFLQGPFSNGIMGDNLRSLGYLPLSSPYSSFGYVQTNNSRSETTTPSVLSVSGNEAIVDWVIVELRSTLTSIAGSRTGLIRRDGKIVDMDGVSPLEFDIANGQYNVVVKHRNHLGVMSLNPISLSSTTTSVDFTTNALQIYGINAQKVVSGYNCLWAGDVTFNGVIKYSGGGNDRDPIMVIVGFVPTNTVPGYYKQDVNMDGLCKYTGSSNDPDIILVNIGGSVPTAVKNQQIP